MTFTNPNFPSCPNLNAPEKTCSYLQVATGNPAVTPVLCLLCRYQGGPFCGAEPETAGKFLAAAANYRKPRNNSPIVKGQIPPAQ